VINIERVIGTEFNDTFVGSEFNNTFVGHAGKDSFDGAGGGDRVAFWENQWRGATAAVVVDLTRATGQIRNDGFGNVETAISIENVSGGNLDDTIKGNGAYNFIEGNEGADTLAGGAGADGFGYYNIAHFGDSFTDFETGVDELYFADLAGLAATPISFRVGNSVAADAGTTGAFYFKTSDRTLYYDQDGTGSAFTGVAVLTVQAGGSVAAGDLFLDF
jgi:Ca2+-binding RTX toxin-like protein